MKKLAKLSFIVLIPLLGGLVLTLVGGKIGNEQVAYAGKMLMSVGTPVTMFILVVVGLVLMITGRLGNDDTHGADGGTGSGTSGGREKEISDIEDVNTSYGYESRMKEAEYLSRHTAKNYKNSSAKEKVLGWLFFGFLMTDFALIPIFAFLGIWVGAIVCFAVFGLTIIISLIVTKILQKSSMSFKIGKSTSYRIFEGKVKACLMSSTTSVGGGHRWSTTRITNVIYRVIVDVDGNEYTAYSDKFYETGEAVTVAVRGKRRASIIEGGRY